jgi:hypothetical protein
MTGAVLKSHSITLVYGQTGMGKTVWTRQHLAKQKRVLCLDPMGEYEGTQFEDLETLLNFALKYRTFYCCYPIVEDFGLLCQVAIAVGDCLLVAEESQRVVPARLTPPKAFEDVIYRGRPRILADGTKKTGVSALLISQRPTTLHIAARSQWSRLVTFRQTEPADANWIRTTSGHALPLETLEPLEYFDVSPGAWEKKVLDVPWKSAILPSRRSPTPTGDLQNASTNSHRREGT